MPNIPKVTRLRKINRNRNSFIDLIVAWEVFEYELLIDFKDFRIYYEIKFIQM
jgi:hypothetical protein